METLPQLKITELTETHWRTIRYHDEAGNPLTRQEAYTVPRPVRSVFPGIRFTHFIVDVISLYLFFTAISFFIWS